MKSNPSNRFVRNFSATRSFSLAALICSAGIALVASPLAQATEYIYNNTTVNALTNWSNATHWSGSAVPVSAATTTLTFGDGASLAASQTILSSNNIANPFQLNSLKMTYASSATAVTTPSTAPTVTVQGNRLEFISNGATAPTMVFNTTGAVKPLIEIKNAINFINDTAITATTDAILSGAFFSTGGFTKSGGGTLRIRGDSSSYAGNIGVSAGALWVGDNTTTGDLGTGTVTLSGSGSFTVRRQGTLTLNNTITGSTSGAVTFQPNTNAVVTIGKANTYTADTFLSPVAAARNGTLKLGIANGLSTSTTLEIQNIGGTSVQTFDLAGFDQTLGAIKTNAGGSTANSIITNTGAATTLTISNASGSTTYAGTISGDIALTKAGGSTQILSGINTYTGDTTVTNGILTVTAPNFDDDSTVTLGSAAMLVLPNEGTDIVGSLVIDGSPQGDGLYTFGTGKLQVGGSNPYSTWSGSAVFDEDDNGDGVSNGLAWIIGAGSPTDNAALGLLPQPVQSGGNLTLTFTQVNPIAPNQLFVEYSRDLGITDPWHRVAVPADDDTVDGVIFDITPATPNSGVTLTIPASKAAGGGKLFSRLVGVQN